MQFTTHTQTQAPTRSQRLAALGHCLLERLETPLFVTDAQGAVLEANPAATRRIERREGLWLDWLLMETSIAYRARSSARWCRKATCAIGP